MYLDKDAHGKYHIMDMDYGELISVARAIIENESADICLQVKIVTEMKRLQQDANKDKL